MRQLTIRNVSEPLGKRLDELSRRTGKSVNALVLELLNGALGVKGRRDRLKSYVSWTADDVREFEQALEPQRQVDEGLWR
jgi:plasmid stability protein